VAAGLPFGLSELTASFKAGVLALFRAAKTTDTALTIGDMTQSLLTAEQVAKLLGVPRSWVYEQSRAVRLPTLQLGRYRRYRREAIDAWLWELGAASQVSRPLNTASSANTQAAAHGIG
jgi:excisionase family DNA binding protein